MAVQQIKAYVEVQSLSQLTQFKGVSGEQVVRAFQLTHRLRENISNIVSALAGQRGPYLIAGPRGSGKSHLMNLIRAFTVQPSLAAVLRDPSISMAVSKLADDKFFIIELDIVGDQLPDLFTLLREELAARDYNPIIFTDMEWEESMSGDRLFKLIRSRITPGSVMILFIDGLSSIMRTNKKARAKIISWLKWAADKFKEQNQALIVTADDDLLSDDGRELIGRFQCQRIDINNLRDIADRAIFKKTELQRQELVSLYHEIVRAMPQFCWTRDDFMSLFPIHPSVLEVAAGLRNYSRSFTFFGFINGAASRAMNRRAMNLSALDELFDSFEFDLRKQPQLDQAFAIYDQIIQQGVPKLSGFDERLWAKLVLKALFLYSLNGISAPTYKLAYSVMLYDDRDPQASMQKMENITQCFLHTVPGAIEVIRDGSLSSYRIVILSGPTPAQIMDEFISQIGDENPALSETLIITGGRFFADWPFTINFPLRAELSIPWRGSMRQGIVKVGLDSELNIPETAVAEVIDLFPSDDDLPALELLDDTEVEAAIVAAIDDGSLGEVCEFDWQLSIVKLFEPLPEDSYPPSHATLLYLVPATPTPEDLKILKQAVIIANHRDELTQEGINCQEISINLYPQLCEMFRRLYIDGGRLRQLGSEQLTFIDVPMSQPPKLVDLLPHIFTEPLDERFPMHPKFGGQLTDTEVAKLAVGLFGGVNVSSSITQSYAELFGLPLGLVSKGANGEYRLDLDSGELYPAVNSILTDVNNAENSSIAVHHIYLKLRREPYGLQTPVQRLILLALIAAWRIEMVDETGSRILGAPQISTENELKYYTEVRLPATVSHSPQQLLEWYIMISGQTDIYDLVGSQERRQVREGLIAWRYNWVALDLTSRLESLPSEVLTTRLWQMIMTCRRYFEAMTICIDAMVKEEISLELCLARIIDTFSSKESAYSKAVNELTMLINFLEWLPFYLHTKNYILSAERTNDTQIEAERTELVGFISQAQRLLDDEKRQRYETIFRSFQTHYIDYYCALHDNIVGTHQIQGQLDELLANERWRTFELLSQLSVANQRYFRLAMEMIRTIKEYSCQLPVRDLLHHNPACACSYRINRSVDPASTLEILRSIIDQGTEYHRHLLKQFRAQLPMLNNAGSEQERSSLEKLLSVATNGEIYKITLSNIETLNDAFAKAETPLATLPVVRLGGRISKQELRNRFEKWLETLPDDTDLSIDFFGNGTDEE